MVAISKTPKPLIDALLVSRLWGLYSPGWPECLYSLKNKPRVLAAKPETLFVDEVHRSDDDEWHFGRVRFFYDRFLAGKPVDPITVDNHCHNGIIYPEPDVLDGHHRLAGALYARVKRIPAYYSGRVDLLNYLKGKRKTVPT
jgi:hypothetical protein